MAKLVPLGEIAEIVSGGTPKSSVPEYWDGEIAWASPKDLSSLNGKFIESTNRKITKEGLMSSSAKLLPPNSVLFSSRAPIGLVAINSVPMATNQGFKSLIPGSDLIADYLYWWLIMNREMLNDLGTGATFKEISKRVIADVAIPLPPLEEQTKISKALDQTQILIRNQKHILRCYDEFLLSTFQKLFPNGSFQRVRLAETVDQKSVITYGIVQAGEHDPDGVQYIRTGDIYEGHIIQEKLLRTSPAISQKYSRTILKEGDIVMSIRATVGTTAKVDKSLVGANLSRGLARISPSEHFVSEYILYALRSPASQNWISGNVKGATFPEITLAKLRELPLEAPPLEKQAQFSKIVNSVNNLKAHYQDNIKAHQQLLNSIFHSNTCNGSS